MVEVPVGSRLYRIEWLATPDKYNQPRLFETAAKARAYDSSGYITAEVEVTTPDGGSVALSGSVPDDALPKPNATVTEVDGNRLAFTNPDGGRWLLIT